MKYLLVIGDGMADNAVAELGGLTPIQKANIPEIDALAARGIVGSVKNCPDELPPGSETAILSIFGCDPLRYFTGRSPLEAAALGLKLGENDVCYRCNLVALEAGERPFEEKCILSHSADSIAGDDALAVIDALTDDARFSAALKAGGFELARVANFRPLLIKRESLLSGGEFTPPHDHLGEVIMPFLPYGSEAAEELAALMRLANEVLENHAVTQKRRESGRLGANGVWIWAEGKASVLPGFEEEYGITGAVVSAVPICHGIGVLRGLEMVEVEGATGELDTNIEGKLEATWQKLRERDFVCLHLEAPDECTHNGDLAGKITAIEWLSNRLVGPLVKRLEEAGEEFRLLLLSDHKTLTATRAHDGTPVPYLLYDSREDTKRGGVYSEAAGESGPYIAKGYELLGKMLNK